MLIRQGIINYIKWEEEGFQIVGEASNGQEALKLMDKSQPHIILTDIVMPVMDGMELVKEVKKRYPQMEIIVLSSFEDFDYVRSAFHNGVSDYILKPKINGPELLTVLSKIVERLPEDVESNDQEEDRSVEPLIKKLLLGYDVQLDEGWITSKFAHHTFSIFKVTGEPLGENQAEIISYLTRIVSGITIYLIKEEEKETIFLLNFDNTQFQQVKDAVHDLLKRNERTKGILSISFQSLHALQSIYNNNLMMLENYQFYLDDQVLIYDEIPKVGQSNPKFDLDYFIELFKREQFSAACEYLSRHVTTLTKQYTTDRVEFKSFLGNVMFNVIVLMGNMKYDTDQLEKDKYKYFSAINEAEHSSEAIATLQDFIAQVSQILSISNEGKDDLKMHRLLHYIEQHCTEQLSLKELANHFHFNPSYLSNYFSTHHHEGFSEYLNKVRINKAADYLKNSEISISDISAMVGYSDHSYFCKVFKKVKGMSPSGFRKGM